MSGLIMVLVYACVAVAIFLVGREIIMWYWKINEAITLLAKIEENTRKPADISDSDRVRLRKLGGVD